MDAISRKRAFATEKGRLQATDTIPGQEQKRRKLSQPSTPRSDTMSSQSHKNSHDAASIPQLPEGWIAHLDPKFDQYYYIHLPTRATQWKIPSGTTFKAHNAAAELSQKPVSQQNTSANVDLSFRREYDSYLPPEHSQGEVPSKRYPPPLPEGWIAHLDVTSGQYYYIHLPTEHTQWEFPKHPYVPPELLSSKLSIEPSVGVIPDYASLASERLSDSSILFTAGTRIDGTRMTLHAKRNVQISRLASSHHMLSCDPQKIAKTLKPKIYMKAAIAEDLSRASQSRKQLLRCVMMAPKARPSKSIRDGSRV